jgi:aminopeptidase YwaD
MQGGTWLRAGDVTFPAHVSPYSLGWKGRAPLVVVSTLAELQAAELSGRIVLLQGELAKEQLMPKDFPFYNPDEHKTTIGFGDGPSTSSRRRRDPEW